MPTKPMRPCGWPGCPELVTRGYCERHAAIVRQRDNERRAARRSTTVRDRVDKRDGRVCVRCGAPGRAKHHIIPLAEGGADDERNVVTLCDRCHREAHARRAGGGPRSTT